MRSPAFLLLLLLSLVLLLAAGCAADSSLNARIAGAEQLAREANEALREADKRTKAEDFDKAGSLLAEAQTKVEDRQMAFYADRENLEDRVSQANSRLAAAREAKHRREIAAAVPGRKQSCDALLVEFRSAADVLQDRPALDRKRVQRAREAFDGALRFLDASKEFEIDSGWTVYAQGARKELLGRQIQITLAEAVISFLEGPVAQNTQAKALFERAKGEKKPEEKAALFVQARDAWRTCGKDAAALVAQHPSLTREAMALGAPKLTAKSFAAACETQAKAVEGIIEAAAKAAAKKPPPATKPAPATKTPPAKK